MLKAGHFGCIIFWLGTARVDRHNTNTFALRGWERARRHLIAQRTRHVGTLPACPAA